MQPESVQVASLASPFLLEIEMPRFVRAGDSSTVQLRIIPQGLWMAGDVPPLLARATLIMENIEVNPKEAVSQPLLNNGAPRFYWHVTATEAGRFRGRLWVHMASVSLDSNASDREQALAALPLEVEARSLFGLDGASARGAGALAIATGALLLAVPHLPPITRHTC